MFTLKVLTLFYLLSGSFGSENYRFNSLVERIYRESNKASLLFTNIDEEVLSVFLKSNPEIPVSILNDYSILDNMQNYISNIILIVQTSSENKKEWEIFQRIISKLNHRQFVIASASNKDNLRDSFVFFADNKFTQIYGVVDDISYGYLPFANQRIQVFSERTPLFDAYKNLNGYAVPITIEQDIPRVFQYPAKNVRIGGFFGAIFQFFLITYNGTYNNIQSDYCTNHCINSINATLNNQVDISTNVYTMGSIHGLDWSYPVRNTFKTVLVPIINHLDTNQYFLRPFSKTVWIYIGLTFVYLVIVDFVMSDFIKIRTDAWKSFSQMFLMMLGLSAGRQLTHNYRFYVQVMFVAFILDNIYLNLFTSNLTVFIKINQFDTTEDFYTHNVRILLPHDEWNRTAYTGMYPENFEALFQPVSLSEYKNQRNAMNNTRNAYLTDSDIAEFLIQLQSLFTKPLFRIIKRPLNSAQLCFVLPKHSPFKHILNRYILNLQQTGLIQKWDRNVLYESLKAKFDGIANRRSYEPPLHTPLSLEHLVFAWNTLAVGMSLALLVFIGEKYENRWKYFFKSWIRTIKWKPNSRSDNVNLFIFSSKENLQL